MSFRIENVSFRYKDGEKVFIDQSFSLPKQGIVEVRGPNGCGKTTLLKLLAGILVVQNESIQQWRKSNQALLFDENILSPRLMTVSEFQSFVRFRFGIEVPYVHDLVDSLPSSARLETLSLGQKQRLVLDTALCASPQATILLDEPLNGLDDIAQYSFIEKLKDMARHRLFIIATHDSRALSSTCLRINHQGDIVEEEYA